MWQVSSDQDLCGHEDGQSVAIRMDKDKNSVPVSFVFHGATMACGPSETGAPVRLSQGDTFIEGHDFG